MTISLPAPMPLAQSRLDGIGLDESNGKGVRHLLCKAPEGPSGQKVPDPFSAAFSADAEVREQFQNILSELLFGQMLKSMRKTVGKAAYFNGGRAEEIFTEQLDQHIARSMSKTQGEQFVGPMYDLTMMGRK